MAEEVVVTDPLDQRAMEAGVYDFVLLLFDDLGRHNSKIFNYYNQNNYRTIKLA